MKNPYDVLGIPRDADTAALREAYRALAGAHGGDPAFMRELDDAYDAIVLSRGGGARGSGSHTADSTDRGDIRQKIQARRYDDALTLLDGMAQSRRDAEWYYLKGCAQRGRGWLEEAEANFAQAARMSPDNSEYRAAYDQMRGGRFGAQPGGGDADKCLKICGGLLCMDVLCKISRC